LIRLHQEGALKVGELITRRYSLDQINDGYRDTLGGRNIRGVVIHGD
jgi:Zn-dependent alcohol dehydrogenase